jgi:hypothetical protein
VSDRPCNLCDYENRKRVAKRERKKLRLRDDDGWLRVEEAPIGTTDWKDAGVLYREVSAECCC